LSFLLPLLAWQVAVFPLLAWQEVVFPLLAWQVVSQTEKEGVTL